MGNPKHSSFLLDMASVATNKTVITMGSFTMVLGFGGKQIMQCTNCCSQRPGKAFYMKPFRYGSHSDVNMQIGCCAIRDMPCTVLGYWHKSRELFFYLYLPFNFKAIFWLQEWHLFLHWQYTTFSMGCKMSNWDMATPSMHSITGCAQGPPCSFPKHIDIVYQNS